MLKYIQISAEADLPSMTVYKPFRAIVVVEEKVSDEWQAKVSGWLVNSGCLYMMAWGIECSSWDDSVDHANLEIYDYGDIPDDQFVMTTWHENKELKEVVWFSKHCALHDHVNIKNTLIIHISNIDKEKELMDLYHDVM